MATTLGTRIKNYRRPLILAACTGVAGAAYWKIKSRSTPRIPEGDIWLDIDLSRPLAPWTRPWDMTNALSGVGPPLAVRDVVDALEQASNDPRVTGLLGRFSYRNWDSMNLACTQEVREAIAKFRVSATEALRGSDGEGHSARRRKFTIAVADTFGEGTPAVGEYYLASAFERIFVQRSGFVGLTGVGTERVFLKRYLDKYGIKPEIFAREEYKNYAQSATGQKFTKANREMITSVFSSLFDDIVSEIALSRGFKTKEEVYNIVNESPLPAQEAIAKNLVDGIMYPHDVDMIVEELVAAATAAAASSTASDKDRADPSAGDGDGVAAGEKGNSGSKTKDSEQAAGSVETRDSEVKGGEVTPPVRVPMSRYIQAMRAQQRKEQQTTGKIIAVIDIIGGISRSASENTGPATSSSSLCKRLKKASKDPRVAAIVLRIDSPGGSAVASDAIAAAVKRVRDAGKPVVCSMGNNAASGGYMIAVACDQIVAQPTTLTGSIGVVAGKVSIRGLLERYGFDVDSIQLGDNHLAFSLLTEFSPAHRKRMERTMDDLYHEFVRHVSSYRKIPFEKVLAMAKGRVWTGRQAHERGLVDHLGGLANAIDITRKAANLPEDTEAIIYPPRKTPRQVLWAAATRLFSSSNDTEGEDGTPRQSIVAALAEALIGSQAVAFFSSVAEASSSLSAVMEGRAPGGITQGGVQMKMKMDEDTWW